MWPLNQSQNVATKPTMFERSFQIKLRPTETKTSSQLHATYPKYPKYPLELPNYHIASSMTPRLQLIQFLNLI